jgi:hypothetical protein
MEHVSSTSTVPTGRAARSESNLAPDLAPARPWSPLSPVLAPRPLLQGARTNRRKGLHLALSFRAYCRRPDDRRSKAALYEN